MKNRPLAILLTAIIAMHALAGGAGSMAVLCLGGGHQHTTDESDHYESACPHGSAWPLDVATDEHAHECGCTDIELNAVELITLPRGENGYGVTPAVVPALAWGIVLADSGLASRGPPRLPILEDPSRAHQLAIVASFRLTI